MCGFDLDLERRMIGITFDLLTLLKDGNPPDDSRARFELFPVGRIAASLRFGAWNDAAAPVMPFTIDQLADVVKSFGAQAVYGTNFFDSEDDFTTWSSRMSVNYESHSDGHTHSLYLFQEGHQRHLDLIVWFDGLHIVDARHTSLRVDDIVGGARRWWDAWSKGDQRVMNRGIFPASP